MAIDFLNDIKVTGDIIIDDGGSLQEASGTAAFTFDGSGHVTKIGQSAHTDGYYLKWDDTNTKAVWAAVTATVDIDGQTDIGAALVDADLFLVDDGANGTNRKATMTRLSTYINGKVPDASGDDKGLVKVSGTAASVLPANISAVTGRSYQLQTDEDGVATVNVPWEDTNTNVLAGGAITGVLDITDTTDSTDATGDTGALRCEGGASIAKKLYAGDTITGSADVIAYSDKKLKENIKTLDGKKVLEMRGVSFDRVDTGKASSGVIAQEMEKVAPELVIDDGNYKGVAYGNVVGYLIEAIKDQQKQIDELKTMCNGCSK
jgi:hypothetical protein